jgi:sarcosine oxidase subunit beta
LDLTRRSKELYEALKRDLEVPYQAAGSLVLFRTAEEETFLTDRCSWLRTQGVPVDMLSSSEVRARLPRVAAGVRGATYAPQDAEVPPREACLAIAQGAARLGVVFRPGTTITELEVAGGRVRGVVTQAGSITADDVVLAAGPWTGRIAASIGLTLPIRPQKGELLHTHPIETSLPGRVLAASYLMSKFGSKSTADGFSAGMVVGQEPDGSLKIGSTREWAEFDAAPTDRARQVLLEEIGQYFPDVAALPIRRQTAGLRPYSMLKRPIIGRAAGVEGLILACGHGGDGIALAPITGWLVAQLIRGVPTGLERELAPAAPAEEAGR